MAELVLSRTGNTRNETVNTPVSDGGNSAPASTRDRRLSKEKPKLAGSIIGSILVGAAAAFLVGGLVGVHETTTSVSWVGHSASTGSTP